MKICIMIKISLKFVPKGPKDNNLALVQIIIGSNADPINWRIYAALGGDDLTHLPLVPHQCVSDSSQHWFR